MNYIYQMIVICLSFAPIAAVYMLVYLVSRQRRKKRYKAYKASKKKFHRAMAEADMTAMKKVYQRLMINQIMED